MNYFIKKWREPLNVLVYIVLVFCFIYFLIVPLHRGIQSKKNEIQEKITEQEFKSKKLQELPNMKKQYEFIESREKDLGIFLKKEDAVVLIEKLEKLAEETNNKIKITISETPETDKGKTVQKSKSEENVLVNSLPSKDYLEIDIRLEGGYMQIISFMHKLESADYYCDIIDIAINKRKVDTIQSTQGSDQLFSVVKGRQDLSQEQEEVVEKSSGDLEALISVAFYLAKQ